MRPTFESFLRALSATEVSSRACNQYSHNSGDLATNAIRRRNLRLYFEDLASIGSRLLLIGEAPSYRGGRLTGVPFTSETILLGGVALPSGRRVLGADRGYRKATPGPRLSTEASATMVWAAIRGIDPLPLLWNSFPFHPHAEGDPDTNRAPSAGELSIGAEFIPRLMKLFPIERVAAIGNHASTTLTRLAIDHVKVRHPSQGGKRKFVEGMARLSR